MKVHDHGLSHLLMQNLYSKLILDIKTLLLTNFQSFSSMSRSYNETANLDLGTDNETFVLLPNRHKFHPKIDYQKTDSTH